MKWLMLSIALVASTPAYAQVLTFIGPPPKDNCGDFLSERREKAGTEMQWWALGYADGLTRLSSLIDGPLALRRKGDDPLSAGTNAFLFSMEKYCRENPTERLSQAVWEFFFRSAP